MVESRVHPLYNDKYDGGFDIALLKMADDSFLDYLSPAALGVVDYFRHPVAPDDPRLAGKQV